MPDEPQRPNEPQRPRPDLPAPDAELEDILHKNAHLIHGMLAIVHMHISEIVNGLMSVASSVEGNDLVAGALLQQAGRAEMIVDAISGLGEVLSRPENYNLAAWSRPCQEVHDQIERDLALRSQAAATPPARA